MNKELISSVLQEFGITEEELQQLPEITQTIDNFFAPIALCSSTCMASCSFTCDVSCGYTVSGAS